MQLRYEYTIDLKYKTADGKITNIDQTNIKMFSISKTYDMYNMPICGMSLTVDKKLADEMILNTKTSTLIMSMYKVQVNDSLTQAIPELYFTEEFTYLTEDDISKNKDQDYKQAKDTEENSREDVYRTLMLGLISKTLVDYNLTPSNTTIYNSSIQDIVVNFLNNGNPLLIEPFSESQVIDQLIISPKESIAKTLDYLNSVRVFYDTGYRFFMDFENMYLVSKSGKPVPRKHDKYDLVKLEIKPLSKDGAIDQGFNMDTDNKCYRINIIASDAAYITDDVTPKTVSGFTAVIDASKAIQQPYLNKSKGFGGILGTYNNIMNTIDTIKKASGSVRQVVGNIHKTSYQIKGEFRQIVDQAKSIKPTVDGIINDYQNILSEIPNEYIRAIGLDGFDINNIDKDILANTVIMNEEFAKKIGISEENFDKFKQAYTGQIYNIENFGSLVGAINPILFPDNISALKTESFKIDPDKLKSADWHDKSMTQFIDSYEKYKSGNKSLLDLLIDTPPEVTYVISEGTGQDNPPVTKTVSFEPLRKYIEPLSENDTFITKYSRIMRGETDKMSESLKVNSAVGGSMKEMVKKTKDIPLNFKKQMLEGSNQMVKSLKLQTETTKRNLREAKANITGQFGTVKDSLNSIKSSGLQALDETSDLSSLGSSGESMIDIGLNLAGIVEDLGKRNIIRIPNDNMNLIKNIKHDLDLKETTLSITKQELDNSLFNINMQYMITNEDDNKKKDGRYLLLGKNEVYSNQGTRFVTTTTMQFAKVPEKK